MNRYKRLFAAGLIAPTVLSNIAPSMGTVYAADQEDIVLNHDDDLQYGSNKDLKTFKVSFYYSYDDGTHIVETTEPIVIEVTEGDSVAAPDIPKLKKHEFIGWDKDIPDTITGSMNFHARYRYIKDDTSINDPSDDTSDNDVSQDDENFDMKKVLTEGVYMTRDEYEDYKKELNSFDTTQMDDAYLTQLQDEERQELILNMESSIVTSALPSDPYILASIEESKFEMDKGTFYPFRSFVGPYLQKHSGETSVDDNVGSVWMKVFKEEMTWTGSGKWSDKYHVSDTDKGVQITYNIGYDDALARAIAPLNSKLLDNMAASQPDVLQQYLKDYKKHPQVVKAIIAHINAVQADKDAHDDNSVYLPIIYDKKHSVDERIYFLNAMIHYYSSFNDKAKTKINYMENELAVAYRQKDSRFQISRSETPEVYDLIARAEISAKPTYYKYDLNAMFTYHTTDSQKSMSSFLLQKTGDFDAAQTTEYHKEFFNYVVSTNKGIGRWMGYFDSTVYKKYDHQSTPANHIFDKTSSATGSQWINLDSARDVFGGDGVFGGDVYDGAVTDPIKTDLYLASMSQGLKNLVNQNSTTKALYDTWYRKAVNNNTVTVSYNLNGGTNSTANPNSINIFDDITFAPASKIGHTFGGWHLDSGFTKKISKFYSGWTHRNDGTKSATLYAKFTPNSYRLTINTKGGKCATGSIAAVVYGNTVQIADPVMAGYTFLGWDVSGAGSSLSDKTFKMGHENATLTAKWRINVDRNTRKNTGESRNFAPTMESLYGSESCVTVSKSSRGPGWITVHYQGEYHFDPSQYISVMGHNDSRAEGLQIDFGLINPYTTSNSQTSPSYKYNYNYYNRQDRTLRLSGASYQFQKRAGTSGTFSLIPDDFTEGRNTDSHYRYEGARMTGEYVCTKYNVTPSAYYTYNRDSQLPAGYRFDVTYDVLVDNNGRNDQGYVPAFFVVFSSKYKVRIRGDGYSSPIHQYYKKLSTAEMDQLLAY